MGRVPGDPSAQSPIHLLLLFSAVSLLSLGCSGAGGGDQLPRAALPVIRDSVGITIVENAEPQWGPGDEWRVGRLLTAIGQAQGDPSHELYGVMDATRLSDGTVAVGNSSSGEIRFYDSLGTFIRTVGAKGDGPGEFRGAGALRALRRVDGDTLLAWDLYGQLVSEFAPDGSFVRSYSLNGPAQRHYFGGVFGDRSLLLFTHEFPPTEPGAPVEEGVVRYPISLHHYGLDHRLANSIRDLPGLEKFRGRFGPWGSVSTDPPFGRKSSFAVGGTRSYVSTGDADEISAYDLNGNLEMLIRRTVGARPVTPEMISLDRNGRVEEEKAAMKAVEVEPRVIRMLEALPYPELLPAFRHAVLDSELNLWAEEFPVTEADPSVWSVFDPRGIWLGRVILPPGLDVYEIGADYVLGEVKDEMDVERILVYELIRG
jgi:YD repeat-containing protein